MLPPKIRQIEVQMETLLRFINVAAQALAPTTAGGDVLFSKIQNSDDFWSFLTILFHYHLKGSVHDCQKYSLSMLVMDISV